MRLTPVRLIHAWLSLVAALALAMAADAPGKGGSSAENPTNALPQTGQAPAPYRAGGYHLSPGDVVALKVFQEDDLSVRVPVTRNGTVSLPLLGSVKIVGMTVEEAAALITGLLDKDYIVKPQVNLSVAEFAKRRFTVLGHVNRPGPYEFGGDEDLNLLQAIAMAGGYTRLGAPWKVTVQRTVDGQQKIFKLDADAMARDKDGKPFQILPEDTITVGQRRI